MKLDNIKETKIPAKGNIKNNPDNNQAKNNDVAEYKKTSNNPNYYKQYQGVSVKFKGTKNVQSFISEIKDTEKTKDVRMDDNISTVKSYKKNDTEYIKTDEGKLYRIRYSRNVDKNAEIVLASKLYNLAGIKTPDMKVFQSDNMTGYASEYTPDLDNQSSNPRASYDSFAADAWLGNWNTHNGDNSGLNQNGEAVKLVTSGSLRYRASGNKKDKFDTNVDELTTMRDSNINPIGANLLENMSDEDLQKSIKKVTSIKNNDIILAVKQSQVADKEQLINTLIGRKNFLKEVKINVNDGNHNLKPEENNVLTEQDNQKNDTIKPDNEIIAYEPTKKDEKTNGTKAESTSSSNNEPEISYEEREKRNKKLDKFLNGDFLEEVKNYESLYSNEKDAIKTIQLEIKEDPRKKDCYADILSYDDHINPYNLGEYTGYAYSRLKIISKLASYNKSGYFLPLNEASSYKNLSNISDEKLNFIVNQCGIITVDGILKINKENIETLKYGFDIKNKHNITDQSLINNIIKFSSDENGEMPQYKKDALNTLLNKDDIFKKGYSSYYNDAPTCLASDIMKLCTSKEKTNDIINNIFPIYEQDIKVYDRKTASDITELSKDDVDKNFTMEKIKFLRNNIKIDDDTHSKYIKELKTKEDFGIFKDLANSNFAPSTIGSVMYWCHEDQTNSYNYDALELAKSMGKSGFKGELFNDYILAYINAKNNDEKNAIIKDIQKIKDYDILNMKITDRVSVGTDRYDYNPSDQKRDLYKNEIYFLKNLPLNKVNRIKEHAETLKRFKLDELSELFDLDPKLQSEVLSNPKFANYNGKLVLRYLEFRQYQDAKNITELDNKQKRSLLNNLIKYNVELFHPDAQELSTVPQFTPKNQEEYCALVKEIVKSIGLKSKPISEETKTNYYKAMDDLDNIHGEFLNTDLTKPGVKLDLAYPRDKFISDIDNKLSSLSEKEKSKATDYFGFELKLYDDGTKKMNGYPINNDDSTKLYQMNPETRETVEEIRPMIKKFSEENKIIPNKSISPTVAKDLNNITKAFPELYTTIGKSQHQTHSYTVDIHTLNVLQNIMKNPKYQYLENSDKHIIQTAALFHDLTKLENVADKTHPTDSAYDAYYLTKKLSIPENKRLQIYELIKNHDFPKQYQPENAKDFAFELKQGNNFKLASILAEADLKSVNRNNSFYIKHKDHLKQVEAGISKYVDELQKTAICMPQTKLPKASELKVDNDVVKEKITYDLNGNAINNKVIYLRPNINLQNIGFKESVKSDDLNVLVHGLDEDSQSSIFQALGQVDSQALLSTSYVNYGKGNYHVFRQHGFILNVAGEDINAAYCKDFGSGCGKTMDKLKSEYLFNGPNKYARNYMSNELKKELNITDEEYKKLYPSIIDKSITELDKTNPKVGSAMRNVIQNMEDGKRSYNRQYNEVLISRPKIQGVFYQGKKDEIPYDISQVPEFLRKYAQEHNVPIIYFGT